MKHIKPFEEFVNESVNEAVDSQLKKLGIKFLQEGTYNSPNTIAIFSGPDGIAEVQKRKDGSYYASCDDYDFEAKDFKKIDELLNEGGHGWAADHITVAKENIDQVEGFLVGQFQDAHQSDSPLPTEVSEHSVNEGQKIIGKTRSGKNIYADPKHQTDFHSFSKEDHVDASRLHSQEIEKIKPVDRYKSDHKTKTKKYNQHSRAAIRHSEWAEDGKGKGKEEPLPYGSVKNIPNYGKF